ncbi:hypothetical protein VN97_g4380 [Penicillium thymicola]|uniref:Lysyl-tRNA synthetase n=1 Tax=Penicillium thymicola TaxID=293382 RepID=A0AAI9TKD4_PENTH|nr:hypothetical protein VN97_g4380 [Penicillium thymicola]
MLSIRPRWALSGFGLQNSAGLRLARPSRIQTSFTSRLTIQPIRKNGSTSSPGKALQDRVQQIKDACADPYPRLAVDARTVSCAEFRSRYAELADNDSVEDTVIVSGRIRTYRLAGSKLIFFDIVQDGHKVQVMCNKRRLDSVSPEDFKKFYRLLRRGDAFSVTGRPHRTGRGELTIDVSELPQLLAPCLHDVPVHDTDHETSPYPRHVQFLANPATADIIRARAALVQYLRQFFIDRSFMEVSTPIVGAVAGGAIARPFYTSATEFPDRQLSLRIAPELWLKRLVIGGFDKIFEIGPSFRNEGLDKTHNAEFTTCEFYHAYANLENLMTMTEDLLSGMAAHIRALNTTGTLHPTTANFTAPFRRIDFLIGIEEATGHKLPNLESPDALDKIHAIFSELSLPLPTNPTLPRLLDELCSIYVESQCVDPTFIINPPECLSPLSKSFIHPTTKQRVAARGELFIETKEVVNTYEEENSPFEQRRKFEDQLRFSKAIGEPGEVDESYLEALEWGLPSTGGWGCGVDRLCMLFTGAKRITDVLPFGNLRAVTRRHGQSSSE